MRKFFAVLPGLLVSTVVLSSFPGISSQAADPRLDEVKVPAGFDKTLFAAPTNISYPTCIAAEPTGEVFVGVDQNGSLDAKPDRGWVVRCIDTDGDGVADKFNVFAKMDSPRGIVFDHNVLYVMHPPFLEAFYDDNGDGVADRSEILVRGLARDLKFRGADHTCNGVRMGIDGWLYIALGDYGATNAVAKDGSSIQLHGGGIVRVRPDGSELEIVSQGTRNIYDVAIDPFMDIFTCDNTNDGDDWNVRLSHMMMTAHYGYPSLFRNFSDEMVPTMKDYGGGSPTGSLFLDEPGFPQGFGHGLYTCQWGWDNVSRHPLKPDGATYQAEKENFVHVPRPTGIDADGQGNVYVASWKGATFTYAGPNVGYIVKVSPTGYKPAVFPNLQKATETELIGLLSSPSAVWRLRVQREILRRGNKTLLVNGLTTLASTATAELSTRVAAIFTLKQMLGKDSQAPLMKLAKDGTLRQYAFKALADRKKEMVDMPTSLFVEGLKDGNPCVRREAIIALNRGGRSEVADAILPLTAEKDVAISHLAFRALVDLDAVNTCFKALDQANSELVPGALRSLRNLHEERVVSGLIERLNNHDKATLQGPILEDLCRIYYREADWDSSWWGTRPDTSGPYFKVSTWDQSERIGKTLLSSLASADASTLRSLLTGIQRNKIELPGLANIVMGLASKDPQLRSTVVDLFARQTTIGTEGIAFLENVALDGKADATLRSRAFEGMLKQTPSTEAQNAAVNVLIASSANAADTALAKKLRDSFIRDHRHGRADESYFEKMAAFEDPAKQEIGFDVLLQIALFNTGQRENQARGTAQRVILAAWKSPQLPSLLHAVGDMHATIYTDDVKAHSGDTNAEVAKAAAYALQQLSQATVPVSAADKQRLISKLSYEEVLQTAIKTPGDAQMGAQLFEKLNCVKCHTISKAEPLKGPFLGDIFARYGRPEVIESILRPNAQIAQGFITTTVETKDGNDYDGFVVKESGDQLEIRNLAGATVIQKKDIAKRGTRTTSIMPEGLADQITPEELASLLAYLQSLKGKQ